MKKIALLLTLILINAVFAKTTINKSIHVNSGTKDNESYSSVNGGITIDDECEIHGSCSTVNGGIRIGEECRIQSLNSVNGSIHIDEECVIDGNINTVNGSITTEKGTTIDRNVETVNGHIKLSGTELGNDIETINGGITLLDKTVVKHDIIIKDANNNNSHRNILEIEINDSVVQGDIINKNEDLEVVIRLRNGGKVLGDIRNAMLKD